MSLLRYKSHNPMRNFVRNLKVVLKSDKSEDIKIQIVDFLLDNTELEDLNKYFYSHPSFNEKFKKDWWGLRSSFARDVFPAINNATALNPWKVLLQECRDILADPSLSISDMLLAIYKSLGWFYNTQENEGIQDWERQNTRSVRGR